VDESEQQSACRLPLETPRFDATEPILLTSADLRVFEACDLQRIALS
jgi:hypothetical protein